jgi:outer membrane protein assembly factor BamB
VTIGGEVTNDGGSNVTEKGICYSTNPNPIITNSKIASGNGTGLFSLTINNLSSNTQYYARAYAVNAIGTGYGNQISFTTNQPAVADSALSLYIGGGKSLFAFNAQTGQLKWKKLLGNNVFSSPAYANGKVYVGCTDNKLYVFDTLGNPVWSVSTNNSIGTQSPIVKNGLVYICNETSNIIYAYNAQTGSLIWNFNATLSGGYGMADITIYDNTLYFHRGMLYALDVNTGAVKWTYNTGGFVSPIVLNNKLYTISGHRSIVVINAASGTLLWEKSSTIDFGDPFSINIDQGKIFYTDRYNCAAYDTINGSLIWRSNITTGNFFPSFSSGTSPLLENNNVYFPTGSTVKILDAQNGAQIWQTFGGLGLTSTATLVNNIVYYGSSEMPQAQSQYHMYAIDAGSKSVKWISTYWDTSPFLHSSPCIVTKSGKVYRLGRVFD